MTRKALNLITLLVVLAVASSLFLFYNTGITMWQAVTDSVISTILLTGFSAGLFQLYRFVPFELERLEKFIVIHLTAGVVVSVFWTNLTSIVLPNLLFTDPAYQRFFTENFVTRFFIGLILYFTFTAFIYLIKAYFLNIESVRTEEALKAQLIEAELNILKLQVNPHFIFNSLNSVAALVRLDPGLSATVIEKLAGFIRLSLEAKQKHFLTLEEELNNVKKYLEIEQVRFGERMKTVYDISPGTSEVKVPSFILLPLAENAVKHGVETLSEDAFIRWSTKIDHDRLLISVVNNTGEVTGRKSGLGSGLKNIGDILRLNYGSEAGMNVNSGNGEFTVTLNLPMDKI